MLKPHLFFRSLAALVASFALINAIGAAARSGFSVAYILFHVPAALAASPRAADACLALLAILLVGSAFGPVKSRAALVGLSAALLGLAAVAGFNAAEFYGLVLRGHITTAWPVPLSLALMIYIVLHVRLCLLVRHREASAVTAASVASPSLPLSRMRAGARRRRPVLAALGGALMAVVAVFVAIIFHVHSLGLTDYRRPAGAIVVLGARVYADGSPSEALRERVLTGVGLYKEGLAPTIIMSGGIGDNGQSEPRAMRDLARRFGVPDEAIIEDEEGKNTAATVRDVEAIARERGLESVLAVSHYHHLPRIKLLFTRRGLPCFTVPADEGESMLLKTPYYVLRETAGLVWAYLHG